MHRIAAKSNAPYELLVVFVVVAAAHLGLYWLLLNQPPELPAEASALRSSNS